MFMLTSRLRLLRALRAARLPLVTALWTVSLVNSLIPAATAVVTAVLVSRISGPARSGFFAVPAVPLILLGVVMVVGHAMEAASYPLQFLAKCRITGAHRTDVARLAASAPTIDRLESPRAQQLIATARADPQNWTERTPGDGAVGQVRWITGLIGAAASCAVLARYAWWLVPILLVPAVLDQHCDDKVAELFARAWRSGIPEGTVGNVWEDSLASTAEGKDIRLYGLGGWAADKVELHVKGLLDPVWGLHDRARRGNVRRFVLTAVPLTVVYALVAAGTAHGHATVAVETAVLTSGWSLFQAFGFSEDSRNTTASMETLLAFDEAAAILRPAAGPATPSSNPSAADKIPDPVRTQVVAPSTPPLVRFEDVCFSYPGSDRLVTDHLDLEIRPHELLAVVGLNGAGKSTMIKLMSGLYTPTSGRITADGADIQDLGMERWRLRISAVFQDFVRYHLTARQNVALGHGNVPFDRAALEAAADDAGFGAVLDRLPEGWDTPLSRDRTGGVDLSGGQWQQVVLARALYAVRTGAQLLVLDEPTAHLDVRTEFEVFNRLAARRGDTSVVLISHRLSTVRHADRIVLLDRGRIAESGTHDELIAAGGVYGEMFAIQAERFRQGYEDRADTDSDDDSKEAAVHG